MTIRYDTLEQAETHLRVRGFTKIEERDAQFGSLSQWQRGSFSASIARQKNGRIVVSTY